MASTLFNGKHYALVTSEYNATKKIYELCKKFDLEFSYPELLNDGEKHFKWLFADDGVGLVGNTVMLYEFTRKNPHHIFHSVFEMRDFLKVAERKEDVKALDNCFDIDAKDKYFNYVDSLSESELREEYRLIKYLLSKTKSAYRKYSWYLLTKVVNPLEEEMNDVKFDYRPVDIFFGYALDKLVGTMKAMEKTINSIFVLDSIPTFKEDTDKSIVIIRSDIKKKYLEIVDTNKECGYYLHLHQLMNYLSNTYEMIEYALFKDFKSQFENVPDEVIGNKNENGIWDYKSILIKLIQRLKNFYEENHNDLNKRFLNSKDE